MWDIKLQARVKLIIILCVWKGNQNFCPVIACCVEGYIVYRWCFLVHTLYCMKLVCCITSSVKSNMIYYASHLLCMPFLSHSAIFLMNSSYLRFLLLRIQVYLAEGSVSAVIVMIYTANYSMIVVSRNITRQSILLDEGIHSMTKIWLCHSPGWKQWDVLKSWTIILFDMLFIENKICTYMCCIFIVCWSMPFPLIHMLWF